MDNALIWIDTETTGLELDCLPLEAACVVTDSNLDIVLIRSSLITCTVDRTTLDPFVFDMHTKNGLFDDLDTRKSMSPYEFDDAFVAELEHIMEPQTAPMAGSTIGFDRRVARANFPKLEKFCHYRSIDVSSVKELARRWAPSIYDARPGKDESEKKHRALDDVLASIEELRYYKQHFFNCELVRW